MNNGERIVDDQVITLLVYSLPKVEIGFYRDPGIFYDWTNESNSPANNQFGKDHCKY